MFMEYEVYISGSQVNSNNKFTHWLFAHDVYLSANNMQKMKIKINELVTTFSKKE